MNQPSKKIIAVFFTHAVSLDLWERRGMFSREVRFYQELADRVGEVWFFTYGRDDTDYQDRLGPNIRVFPKRLPIPNLLYDLLLPFLYWNQLRQADIVRIHQMAGAIPVLIAHWTMNKPLIVRCGYQWSVFLSRQRAFKIKQWIVARIESVTYHAAKMIIVATPSDAEHVKQSYKIATEKIHVISNYVDTNLFKPLMIEKKPRSICFVGRLEPQKNLMNLVEAVQGTNAHLVFYGEGSLRNELEQHAQELNVRANFRGKIANDELPAALNACELFILPSLYEGNPKVLLEAMACGLPVIGTNVEGIREIIEDGENGILCEPSTESIHEALKRLMNDPATQQRLGGSARQTILATASLSNAVQTECDLVHSVGL